MAALPCTHCAPLCGSLELGGDNGVVTAAENLQAQHPCDPAGISHAKQWVSSSVFLTRLQLTEYHDFLGYTVIS